MIRREAKYRQDCVGELIKQSLSLSSQDLPDNLANRPDEEGYDESICEDCGHGCAATFAFEDILSSIIHCSNTRRREEFDHKTIPDKDHWLSRE